MSFGIGNFPPQGMNPDEYAKVYAQQNGISLDEAKNQLRQQYGDPNPPNFMQAGFQRFKENQATLSPDSLNQEQNYVSASSSISSSNSAPVTDTTPVITTPNSNLTFVDLREKAKAIYNLNEKYQTTKQERKEIVKLTKTYTNQIDTFIKEYMEEHKSDYKSLSNRSERKAMKSKTEQDAQSYALRKFRQLNPDVDLITVFYNAKERITGGGLFTHANLKPYN